MKRIILSLVTMLIMCATAQAQRLVSVKNYGANWQKNMIALKNKPNGTIYRLRVEKQNEYLPRGEEAKDLEQFISERIDIGWLALYRRSAGDQNYKFIVKIYDKDEKPLYTIDLGQVSDNNYCEVQDVRWDNDTHNLLFNMACPSYASGVNGKGSKLHCYNPERREMVWSTDWLTSNDIFILDSKFVFCSYGFTSEKKFLFMLDKLTGKVYSKLPFTYKVEYLELQTEQNGREYLYAMDYNDHLYKFYVEGAKTVAENGKVFTVVYAESDDGFLNVRLSPSMKGEIATKLWMLDHGLGRGVLLEKGKQWSKVSVDGIEGWVYTKYLGQMTWMAGSGPKIVANKNAVIYCEDNAEGTLKPFYTIPKGTIIADTFFEHSFDGVEYYELRTGHDYLFVKKTDVIVK
jgi:outer membrane protein assembly factor BamB